MNERTTEEEVMFSGRWLRLKKVFFNTPDGQRREWETLERTTKQNGPVDAVEIIAILHQKEKPDSIILIKQFRPPVGSLVLELPAGLLDKGETPETCAIRELKEETGFIGTLKTNNKTSSPDPKSNQANPTVYFGQAVSNTSSKIIILDVDGDSPMNQKPSQHLDEMESITDVCVIPLHSLSNFIQDWSSKGGSIDGKIMLLCLSQSLSF